MALLMLLAGMALLFLVYLWLTWYASLQARVSTNITERHGLSKSDIQKLPTVICSSNTHQEKDDRKKNLSDDDKTESNDEFFISGDLECCVCLEQFKDGERCVLMPKCRHCFHLDCAGAWLSKHSICPLCRSSAHPNQHDIPHSAAIDILA
ncbi:hypothetical protein SUGI_0294960 [Cryptomeria japonica]|nr:hypothetical protein SUGI_0294960 [Cryptomeria japonica]